MTVAVLVVLLAAACTPSAPPRPTATVTPVPTDTSTPQPSDTPRPTSTPLPTVTPMDAAVPTAVPSPVPGQPEVSESVPPPYTIALPEGWASQYVTVPVRDLISRSAVAVAAYAGPVPGHDDVLGHITVFWGFPSLSAAGMSSDEPDLWADGLRFLRGALLDSSCNIGTDLARAYRVGDRENAIGTAFSAVGCQGEPDTAGWFAGIHAEGGNYIFYVYTEPLEGIDVSQAALQSILDTIAWEPLAAPAP